MRVDVGALNDIRRGARPHFYGSDIMDNENLDDEIVIENCESCHYPVAAKRPESGMVLCDICAPWVEVSMSRTAQIPSWSRNFAMKGDEFEEAHKAFWKLDRADETGDWGTGMGSDTPAPRTEYGWVEFLEWALDGVSPEILSRVRVALDARSSALNPDTPWVSVEAIGNRLKMAQQGVEHIAGHMVTIDEKGTWVDDGNGSVLFGHRAYELHCQRSSVLPELMFDRYHGLDTRPLEELAYLYWREPWMSLIDTMTGALVPAIPAMRDEFSRMATGAVGRRVADRCRLAILLWSTHVEREFLTCDRDAWKLSFQWVRELVEEFAGSVKVANDGIYVDGLSGNLYRIAPEKPVGSSIAPALNAGDYFEVRKVTRIGDEMTKPICIHVKTPDDGGSRHDVILGDVVAGLLMALRNDLITAEVVGPLFRHLPRKFRERDRPGDRQGWRRRFRELYPGMEIDQRLNDMLDAPEEEE
jgi:hypothetical protein